jgi:hypothetical protein
LFPEADAVAGLQRWVAARPEMAQALEQALADTIAEGKVRTYDLGGGNTTVEVVKAAAASAGAFWSPLITVSDLTFSEFCAIIVIGCLGHPPNIPTTSRKAQ